MPAGSDVPIIFTYFKRINLISRANLKLIATLKEILMPKQVAYFL